MNEISRFEDRQAEDGAGRVPHDIEAEQQLRGLPGLEDSDLTDTVERVCARLPLDYDQVSAVTQIAIFEGPLWPETVRPYPGLTPARPPDLHRPRCGQARPALEVEVEVVEVELEGVVAECLAGLVQVLPGELAHRVGVDVDHRLAAPVGAEGDREIELPSAAADAERHPLALVGLARRALERLDGRRHVLARLEQRGELIQAGIGNAGDADRGLEPPSAGRDLAGRRAAHPDQRGSRNRDARGRQHR